MRSFTARRLRTANRLKVMRTVAELRSFLHKRKMAARLLCTVLCCGRRSCADERIVDRGARRLSSGAAEDAARSMRARRSRSSSACRRAAGPTLMRGCCSAILPHIPGAPSIIVQNMPGAGIVEIRAVSRHHCPDDGTVMVRSAPALLTEALTAPERVKVDFRNIWLDRQYQRGLCASAISGAPRRAQLAGHAGASASWFSRHGVRHGGQCRYGHAARICSA